MNLRPRVIEALVLLVAIAVVARVVFGLLGPLLPGIAVALVVLGLIFVVLRGPHAGH